MPGTNTRDRHFEPLRLCGLSDAIFAIVLTLLVLELKSPERPSGNLLSDLSDDFPKMEAWVISFIVVGVFWVIHHNVLGLIPHTNTNFNYLNLLLLMCISLIPWTSSLLGGYSKDPFGVVFFSGNLGLAGLVLTLQWLYASGKSGLASEEISPATRKKITLLILRVPVVAAISVSLAFVNRTLSLWTWILVIVLGALIRIHRSRIREREEEDRAPDRKREAHEIADSCQLSATIRNSLAG